MSKKNRGWNAEKILSISAISISFITLLIFVYQTNLLVNQTKLLSEQNYLSILPYLAISTSSNAEKSFFELSIQNQGVGPAIIESVIFFYEGQQYDLADFEDSIYTFIRSKSPEMDSIKHFSVSTLNKGLAIPANTNYHLISVENHPKEYLLINKILNQLSENGLRYEITYKSIQKERWRIHNDSQEPEELK